MTMIGKKNILKYIIIKTINVFDKWDWGRILFPV